MPASSVMKHGSALPAGTLLLTWASSLCCLLPSPSVCGRGAAHAHLERGNLWARAVGCVGAAGELRCPALRERLHGEERQHSLSLVVGMDRARQARRCLPVVNPGS